MRFPIGCLVALVVVSPALADKKADRAKEIQAEITKLQAKVAVLQRELLLLRLGDKDVVNLIPRDFKVGQVGRFRHRIAGGLARWDLKITEIIDGAQMIVHVDTAPVGYKLPFILRNWPTKGLVEGKVITSSGIWELAETKKYRGRTYYVFDYLGENLPAKK